MGQKGELISDTAFSLVTGKDFKNVTFRYCTFDCRSAGITFVNCVFVDCTITCPAQQVEFKDCSFNLTNLVGKGAVTKGRTVITVTAEMAQLAGIPKQDEDLSHCGDPRCC